MTEAEWMACADPTPMLTFLRPKASDRKLRLFACDCCGRLDYALAAQYAYATYCEKSETLTRNILDVWERHIEGQATDAETDAAEQRANSCSVALNVDLMPTNPASLLAAYLSCVAVARLKRRQDPLGAAVLAADCAARAAGYRALVPLGEGARFRLDEEDNEDAPAYLVARNAEWAAQRQALRCIFGNPFQLFPAVPVAWLAWNDGTVAKLAAAIYEERRFADLPILADALEDAGCDNADVLGHCREPGEHMRGCWCVDLLTGRG